MQGFNSGKSSVFLIALKVLMYVMYGTFISVRLQYNNTMVATVTKSSIVEYVAIRHFFLLENPMIGRFIYIIEKNINMYCKIYGSMTFELQFHLEIRTWNIFLPCFLCRNSKIFSSAAEQPNDSAFAKKNAQLLFV